MKNKLIHYLTKECEALNDILMQTKEIRKSIEMDDIEYANRLFTGRNKNILKANRFQEAALKMMELGTELTDDNSQVSSLKEKSTDLLQEIKRIDEEINTILSKGYADTKKEYKNTKEANLIRKNYAGGKGHLPKLFDKKT